MYDSCFVLLLCFAFLFLVSCATKVTPPTDQRVPAQNQVSVPVQGKYGIVYIGKTWLGDYDKQGNFTARYPDNLMAWFFLDFNPQSLNIQQQQHWDGSKETKLDPLPHVVD